MLYKDRFDAGKKMATLLRDLTGEEMVVLAVPNGGIPVGLEIARQLNTKFGLMLTRRINLPFTTEAGFGAVAFDGQFFIDNRLARRYGMMKNDLELLKAKALEKIHEKMRLFGFNARNMELKGKTVIITDDGIAGGYTMFVALKVLEKYKPSRKVVAVPTAPKSSVEKILHLCDDFVCPNVKEGMYFAVADAYAEWYDLSDSEVVESIQRYRGLGVELL
ncbi:MAG: phosphoribosyltransferase [Promethearchaeota archaeon]